MNSTRCRTIPHRTAPHRTAPHRTASSSWRRMGSPYPSVLDVDRAHRRMKAKASALDTNQTFHRSSCGDQQEDTRVNDTRERLKPATRSTRPKTSTRHTRKSRPPKKRVSSAAHDATSLPPSLLQSASSPAVSDVPVPTAGADGTLSTPAVTTATATDHRASVDMEGQGSPRARQRLEEAKALDREITISEGIDGGG